MQLFENDNDLPYIMKHKYVVEDLDKPRIQEMSNLLADPNNLSIFIRSKKFEGQLKE